MSATEPAPRTLDPAKTCSAESSLRTLLDRVDRVIETLDDLATENDARASTERRIYKEDAARSEGHAFAFTKAAKLLRTILDGVSATEEGPQ